MSKNYFMIDGKKIPMSEETAKSILDSQKPKTYSDISRELFKNKSMFHLSGARGDINYLSEMLSCYSDPNNSATRKQLESILALNKLCNVAKYLNKNWLPKIKSCRKHIILLNSSGKICTDFHNQCSYSVVYFKTRKLAEEAIDILGEDEIRKALTLNH